MMTIIVLKKSKIEKKSNIDRMNKIECKRT